MSDKPALGIFADHKTDAAWMTSISLHQTDQLPWQRSDRRPFRCRVHPLTCGNDSNHTPLFPAIQDGRRVLICRDCDYTQDCGPTAGAPE